MNVPLCASLWIISSMPLLDVKRVLGWVEKMGEDVRTAERDGIQRMKRLEVRSVEGPVWYGLYGGIYVCAHTVQSTKNTHPTISTATKASLLPLSGILGLLHCSNG